MKSKSFIFLFVLVFMIVFSLSAVSADDLQTTDSGQVSGDVDVATVSPWDTTGELTYDIPAEAKEIKSADVYVNVYAGSAANTRGANANVSLKTADGENQIASEELWIENGTSDGTIYPVNDHTDKCYSDYQMHYDVTDSLKGLNGSSIAIKVNTFEMENKTFDGRIKLIALILAYDDGDNDKISYWVDTTQKWTKTNVTTTFDTEALSSIKKADLINVALSSANGNFTLNEEPLGSPDDYSSGSYYQYSCWDVSDKLKLDNVEFIVSDIDEFNEPLNVDTLFQNPPFGSQRRADKGQDLKFVKKAVEINAQVLYSFHMASTEEFLMKFYADNNLEITHIFRYKFPIPKIYDFHNKEKQIVDVIVIRAILK